MRFAAYFLAAAALTPLANNTVAFGEDSLVTRSSLLDYSHGPKQWLGAHGVDLGMDYTPFYQGLVGGTGDEGWEFGGKSDILVKVNAEKLGLWPGLFLSAHTEFVNGEDVLNRGDGSVLPVNTALAFPSLAGRDSAHVLSMSQVFNDNVSLSIGKFNMLDAAANTPLLGGGGLTTFMNTALAAPISGVTPPYIVGAILPYKTETATVTLMVYDPRNAQNSEVLENPFQDGVTTSLSITAPIKLAGKRGYQTVRGVYSSATGINFSDIPDLNLPPASQAIETIDGYWFGSYSFQQYLIDDENDPSRGWGIFGQATISDGNPNPFGWSGFLGLGGSSLLPSRPNDRFGIAYFYYGFSDELLDGLDALGFDYSDESGVEVFYNFAATDWLKITTDGQVISPGASDETAYFLGLRAHVKVF